jgi:hypothetical protein
MFEIHQLCSQTGAELCFLERNDETPKIQNFTPRAIGRDPSRYNAIFLGRMTVCTYVVTAPAPISAQLPSVWESQRPAADPKKLSDEKYASKPDSYNIPRSPTVILYLGSGVESKNGGLK